MPYPGGPVIDRLAADGDPYRFSFPKPKIAGLNFSFSGLKTSFLYFIRDELLKDSNFIQKNLNDLCASIQHVIVSILMDKIEESARKTGIKEIAIAGGVSANSMMRSRLKETGEALNWKVFIPEVQFTTDNAAMIAIAGYYKYLKKDFADQRAVPYARSQI